MTGIIRIHSPWQKKSKLEILHGEQILFPHQPIPDVHDHNNFKELPSNPPSLVANGVEKSILFWTKLGMFSFKILF